MHWNFMLSSGRAMEHAPVTSQLVEAVCMYIAGIRVMRHKAAAQNRSCYEVGT